MRGSLLLMAALAVGCFNPSYPDRLQCGPDGWCPSGQVCDRVNICVSTSGDGSDAAPDARSFSDADNGLGALVSISIGDDVTLEIGQTKPFEITGIFENGTAPINEFARWESTDNNIAWLDFNGVVTAAAEGTATATCSVRGRVASAMVTVIPPP